MDRFINGLFVGLLVGSLVAGGFVAATWLGKVISSTASSLATTGVMVGGGFCVTWLKGKLVEPRWGNEGVLGLASGCLLILGCGALWLATSR